MYFDKKGAYSECNYELYQGRSQPHSLGWAKIPLSSFLPQILINLSYFSQTYLIFLFILALRVGDSPNRKGPGYATEFVQSLFGASPYTGTFKFAFFLLLLFGLGYISSSPEV